MEHSTTPAGFQTDPTSRLEHLDATRAAALLLGIVFHACLSFSPIFLGWAVQDISTSPWILHFMTVSHSFRMELFFLLAGFLSHRTVQRKGAGAFLRDRLLRIGVPFVAGWFLLRPLLISGWIMGSQSLRGDVDITAGWIGGILSLSTLPAGIFTGTHLWFLYYLMLISVLALALRGVTHRCGLHRPERDLAGGADAVVAWIVRSRFSLVIPAVPTAVALWFMRSWSMDTPDRSLAPHVPVLIIYGAFFGLGWFFGRQRGVFLQATQLTLSRVLLAGVSIGAVVFLEPLERDPAHPQFVAAHVAHSLCYALMMWSLVFLTLGFFQRLIQAPKPWIRYLADSSYWLYLIHLPVVVWLQVAVAELPLNWVLKLALVTITTTVVGLITYDLFVRPTFLGQLLHGRRHPRVLFRWIPGLPTPVEVRPPQVMSTAAERN